MQIQSIVRLTSGFLLCLTTYAIAIAQNLESDPNLVVVISGFGSDPSPKQLSKESPRGQGNSGMYQLTGELTKAGFETRFFNWNGTDAGKITQDDAAGADGIASFIRDQNSAKHLKHIILIGHSWGGHTMLEVAEKLQVEPPLNVSLAIGVDPSSLSRGERMKILPSTIQSFVNYHTHNAFVWGRWKDDDRVQNVDLGDPSGSFGENNRRNYAARFDITAHNAAEWDKLIHVDIIQRIKNVLAAPKSRALNYEDK